MSNNSTKFASKTWGKILAVAFVVTAFCEVFLLIDVAADFLYIDIDTSWLDHNVLELISVLSLGVALIAIGTVLGVLFREREGFQVTVQAATGEFAHIVEAKFDDWLLSPSEREIAFLLIKGYSVQEICDLRDTRPGTVKSQSNAIYRKAGVHGRTELVAYFVEDLLGGEKLVKDGSEQV
ncbi:helix-turn-helix transcriptional regulator [Magnetovibrio sp. PR-2]|uniref:helix-turn-helix transcriptional regulator n=1 Tax=Magnetovibrio sp. PR-2 TaxID=3120356 RepID=UPI002FCE3F69